MSDNKDGPTLERPVWARKWKFHLLLLLRLVHDRDWYHSPSPHPKITYSGPSVISRDGLEA